MESMGLEQGGWQHHSLIADLERLVGAMQAVEQACAALQVRRDRRFWKGGCNLVRVEIFLKARIWWSFAME